MKLIGMFAILGTVSLLAAAPALGDSINLNSSRSNTNRLDPKDLGAATACTNSGGTVSTDNGGQTICIRPEAAAPAPIAPGAARMGGGGGHR